MLSLLAGKLIVGVAAVAAPAAVVNAASSVVAAPVDVLMTVHL